MGGPNDANVVIIDDDDTCMLLLPPLQTSEVATGLQLETYRRAANSRIQRLKNKKAADYTLSNASRHVIHTNATCNVSSPRISTSAMTYSAPSSATLVTLGGA